MKKSRIAKFALLGASAAALAATLSTSTYAWYVSNKTATVGTATGATAGSTADGSILLSWDNNVDHYYREITWTDDNAPSSVANTISGAFLTSLVPLYYNATDDSFESVETYKLTTDTAIDGTKTYYTKSGSGTSITYSEVNSPVVGSIATYYERAKESTTTTGGYIQFSMYIKADATTNVTITPTFANTTSSESVQALKQLAYVATGGVTERSPFIVNSFDAMYYSLAVDDAAPSAVAATPASTAIAGAVKPAAAHTYYEAVTGEEIAAKYKVEPATSGSFTVQATTTAKKLTWTIWLAGNDVDCYNSCAGQSFTVAFTYKAA